MSLSEIRPMSGSEAWEADVVAVLTRPVITGQFWVDLESAAAFLEGRRAQGRALTWTHLFIKAAARAALETPALHRMFGPLYVLEPRSADVGVSVEGEGALAPVVILQGAEQLPLDQIAVQLKEKSAQAKEEDRRVRQGLDRWIWLLPFAGLRRMILALFFWFPGLRRRLVGSVQLTNIGHFEIDLALIPMVAELLLCCGKIEVRARSGPQGEVLLRRGALFTIQASHRKLNGTTAGRFISAFRRALEAPETLE